MTDRETARAILTAKIESQTRQAEAIAAGRGFSTISPAYLIRDAEWRLRWIDCAPDGANHLVAPLQDKRGVPMGGVIDENVGPGQAVREARIKHGLHPIYGGGVTT